MAISSELACVLNAVDEPAILIRPEDMTVAAANAAFLRTFGAFRFEGRRCWEAMHRSEDCALCGLGCPRREAMRTRQESVLEQTVFTSSRASRFRVALSPVYASDGSLRYWLERIRVEQGLGMNDMSRGQVGESALHQALMRELAKAAAAHYPILIVGEKGLGKELYARTVHENSVRASRPFVAVPAEVLTESNFRELLFGRMRIRGSRGRTGLLSQAAGGTLFVDALEKLPLAVQEEVARVLEVGVFWPASAQVPMIAAFRFMASAALPITELVREKRLHESLARILEHHVVYVAPLRERKEDIAPLARHFVRALVPVNTYSITQKAVELLQKLPWPGNARQLRETLECAAMRANGFTIAAGDIPSFKKELPELFNASCGLVPLAVVQEQYLLRAVRDFTGSRAQLARVLGVSERKLYRLWAAVQKSERCADQCGAASVSDKTRHRKTCK